MDRINSVILNYNDAETTINLLEKIRNYSAYDHIIVVDNCSTDDSYSRLQAYQNEKIIVIRTDQNGGYGYGNNYGIRYAHEKFSSKCTLISNPDVEYSESTLIGLYDALEENKDASVISTIAYKPNGQKQKDTAWRLPSVMTYTLSASIIFSKLFRFGHYPEGYFEGTGVKEVECVPGSLLMVKTSEMIEYGMYDENIFLYCEETTLGHKFKNAGRKTLILLDGSYIHHHSVSINKSIKGMLRQRKLLFESKYKFIKTYLTQNKAKLLLVRLFIKLALIENRIIYKIKGV